jgi:2-hydroxychromene-2-carboxylate isomerase
MTQPIIEFWFDFGSSYAYFASLEIEALTAKHGRAVVWRPYMLGQAFNVTGARGLSATPLKRDYALNDWNRIARLRGVKFALPAHHPSITVPAMRAVYHLERSDPDRVTPFVHAVFAAYFHDGLDTGDAEVVRGIGESIGLDGAALAAGMADPEIKALAKARSQEAVDRGVFGSPWMFVDGEPFWGWDRLPMIDDWLARGGW